MDGLDLTLESLRLLLIGGAIESAAFICMQTSSTSTNRSLLHPRTIGWFGTRAVRQSGDQSCLAGYAGQDSFDVPFA